MKIIDEVYPKMACEVRLSEEGNLWIKTDTENMKRIGRIIIENPQNKFCKVFYQEGADDE